MTIVSSYNLYKYYMYNYKIKMALVKLLIGGNLMGKDEMNSKSNKTWTDTYESEIKRMIKGIRDPRLMRYIYLIVKDAISENIDR